MDAFPMEVGRRLRLQRVAFGWRQSDLRLHAGVTVQTIKKVEKGEAISSSNLLRILLAPSQGTDFLNMLERLQALIALASQAQPPAVVECAEINALAELDQNARN
ncbi:MAG: helix-turn-helix domain-containing protein [Pseudomonas sp.]